MGGTGTCTDCDGPIRRYLYRLHPPESSGYERCVGISWCAACRTYSTFLGVVPRERALTDALAELPAEERERLLRKEHLLVAHLARRERAEFDDQSHLG
ncbi:hypothetical protein ACIQF6_31715 [Kitasatospora sp. NPDC092948]|uniref:hypothetical protein n=1 Tax=Kitasatospora sp. NPDC092948 TaxID=3364088 RepID=UPI00380B3421